jgi:hypothetical protein
VLESAFGNFTKFFVKRPMRQKPGDDFFSVIAPVATRRRNLRV